MSNPARIAMAKLHLRAMACAMCSSRVALSYDPAESRGADGKWSGGSASAASEPNASPKPKAAKPPKAQHWGPTGKKLQWQDAGQGSMWARFKTKDDRQYSHKYRIQKRAPGEWVTHLETPEGLHQVGGGRTPNEAKKQAQQHMERTVEGKTHA